MRGRHAIVVVDDRSRLEATVARPARALSAWPGHRMAVQPIFSAPLGVGARLLPGAGRGECVA